MNTTEMQKGLDLKGKTRAEARETMWRRIAGLLGAIALGTSALCSHWWHQARYQVCPVCREAHVNLYHPGLDRLMP